LPAQTLKTHKMSTLLSDTKKTIKDVVTSYDTFRDEIIFMEFDRTSFGELRGFAPLTPTRFDSLVLIGITDGEIEIQIDYISYKAGKNSLAMIMPSHISNFINGDNNLKGWIFVISKLHLESYSNQIPSVMSYMQIKKHPLTQFDNDEYQSLYPSLNYIRTRMNQHTHIFHQEAIRFAIQLFFFDLGNLFFGKKKYHLTATLSRKEEIFADFQMLLREHCKKQHDVKYYANELCITTQYLSSILKDQSGLSASRWIQEALIIEAKGLLKRPRVNVQQVADKLNFPDQSTFGKFFKKHTGLSPMSFRKS